MNQLWVISINHFCVAAHLSARFRHLGRSAGCPKNGHWTSLLVCPPVGCVAAQPRFDRVLHGMIGMAILVNMRDVTKCASLASLKSTHRELTSYHWMENKPPATVYETSSQRTFREIQILQAGRCETSTAMCDTKLGDRFQICLIAIVLSFLVLLSSLIFKVFYCNNFSRNLSWLWVYHISAITVWSASQLQTHFVHWGPGPDAHVPACSTVSPWIWPFFGELGRTGEGEHH